MESWLQRTVELWTVEEFFADARPTDDDVPIAADGRVLDTPAKVIAYIDEINARRVCGGTGWLRSRSTPGESFVPSMSTTSSTSS